MNKKTIKAKESTPKKASPEMESVASFPAMMMTQNKRRFYLASLPVGDIFDYCFVARRIEDPTDGFQRTLGKERAQDIANYLDDSKGSIPTNIVLSAQPEANLKYLSGTKTIKYNRVKKGFLVIDGQHRLYGYGLSKKGHRVPVAIYDNLSRQEEASLFIDINTNQKGVPAALLLDIKQVANQENDTEQALRRLFDQLNQDSSSSFDGLLSPSKSVPGKLSRVSFNRGMKEVISNSIVASLSIEKQYVLVKNYFNALDSTLKKPSLVFKSVYFESFCMLLTEVLRLAYSKFKNYKYASLNEVLSPLANIDLGSIQAGGKTKLTKSSILPVLHHAISSQITTTDDMVWAAQIFFCKSYRVKGGAERFSC